MGEKITAYEAAKMSKEWYKQRIEEWNRNINDFLREWVKDPQCRKDRMVLREDELDMYFGYNYHQYAKEFLENRGFIVEVTEGFTIEKRVCFFFKKDVYSPETWEILNPYARR